ncbi:hypothetical protein ACRS52_21300 [Bacillus cytotoxicus]|uniref:Group-specific protein n=1 Tax=Bacillus cytotoxicus TaxID=580165 RepID=A0AAX2CNY0_9BACI|nr:hypothetical protein [Bacillus cytotoxicus]SCM08635.1 Uncharacterized protein BCB44BAC_04649 [Bacillus cytotoxicus]
MIKEFMTKTRFTINVDFSDVINFVLILFGLGVFMAGFATKIIVDYEFSFTLCIVSFVAISICLLEMVFCVYLLPKWISKRKS